MKKINFVLHRHWRQKHPDKTENITQYCHVLPSATPEFTLFYSSQWPKVQPAGARAGAGGVRRATCAVSSLACLLPDASVPYTCALTVCIVSHRALSSNRISSLAGALRGLTRLQDLLLARNQLRRLQPDVFQDTPHLQLLSVDTPLIDLVCNALFASLFVEASSLASRRLPMYSAKRSAVVN